MANYLVTDTELTSIADAIRTKGGTSESLEFPTDFVSAIENIPSGGGGGGSEKTVTINLLNPSAPSSFRSFTIYETTDGVRGNQIGSISSATGSTTVTVGASANGIVCEIHGSYVSPSTSIGDYFLSGGIGLNLVSDGTGQIGFIVASNGEIDIHHIDYDD